MQFALTVLLLVATAAAAPAADRYWSGTGTWTTTTATWGTVTGGPYNAATWNNSPADAAFFEGTAGTVTLGGPITAAGLSFSVDGYTVTGNTLTLSGTPSINTPTGISARIASTLAGGVAIAKTGNGTLELTAANTYTGSTTISGGTLSLLAGSKLSRATSNWGNVVVTVSNNAVLQIVDWYSVGNLEKINFYSSNLVLNAGTIRYTGGTTENNDGYGRAFTIGASGATLDCQTTGTDVWHIAAHNTFGIASTQGGTLTLTGTGMGSFNKAIPGSGGLTKSGSGTWALSAVNTYTGNTTITGGTLQLTAAAKLYSNLGATNRVIDIQTGGVLALDSWVTGGNLGQLGYGNGNVVLNGGTIRFTGASNSSDPNSRGITINAAGGSLETATAGETWFLKAGSGGLVANGGTLTLAGAGNGELGMALGGTGGLLKRGSGTWTITGVNLYAGATTISAGTLKLGAAGTIDNSPTINVANGATLDVTDKSAFSIGATQTLTGRGTVDLGGDTLTILGTLEPGASPGTLTVDGALTLAGTSTFELETVSNYDKVVGVSDITFGGTLNVANFNGGPAYEAGQVYRLFEFSDSTPSGQFDVINLPALDGGLSWKTYADGKTFDVVTGQIAVVPEPSTLTLLAGGLIGPAFWALRRRKYAVRFVAD